MRITSVTAMYFSGTGKTKFMTLNIASILAMKQGVPLKVIDFSLPQAREEAYEFSADDLIVIGVPVYAGRVPNLLLPFLKEKVKGAGVCGCEVEVPTLCVPVVTFGNRSYDNALIELRNIMTENGFACIGAGAFCAQHSFSQVLGAGRPDSKDIYQAEELALITSDRIGKLGYRELMTLETFQITNRIELEAEKMDEAGEALASAFAEAREALLKDPESARPVIINGVEIPVTVKGDATASYYQPRDREGNSIDIRKVKPKTSDACTRCGKCAEICPMGAIDRSDFSNITGICIKCCACERSCPVSAKYFDDPGYIYHKEELEAMYGDVRAESEIF